MNNSFTMQSAPSPVSMFEDSFSYNYGLRGNINQSIICQGTGTFLGNIDYVPSRSGYCSLVSTPHPENRTVFSVGCSQCIDTSFVCIFFYFYPFCDITMPNFSFL